MCPQVKCLKPLSDGRKVRVFPDEPALSAAIVEEVVATAKAAIAAKGSFSLAVPAGSVVKSLKGLESGAVDFSKVCPPPPPGDLGAPAVPRGDPTRTEWSAVRVTTVPRRLRCQED